jgi:uncharacterized damage-inducible protein DinB
MNHQNTQDKIGVNKTANYLLVEWGATRKLTLDFITSVSLKKLNTPLPRPGLNTIYKHLVEMAQVQRAYTNVLKGKELDFSKVISGENIKPVTNRSKIVDLIKKEDDFLQKNIEEIKNWDKQIKVFGENYILCSVIEFMIRHETLHHGQFVAFGYLLGIKFPDSWIKQWALP